MEVMENMITHVKVKDFRCHMTNAQLIISKDCKECNDLLVSDNKKQNDDSK